MKSNSNTQPPVLLDLGDGSWHYNFNIEEVQETIDEVVQTQYRYDTVQFVGPPNYEAVVKAVIRERYDETKEFGIINDYNEVILGLSEDESAVLRYTAFLEWKNSVKQMVSVDFR